MPIRSSTITFVTAHLPETRAFYERHFAAQPVFDCGWYVTMRLGLDKDGPEIALMQPREGDPPFAGGAYLNLRVDDVDQFYRQVVESGLTPDSPPADHPWGDRGFRVSDPSGVTVYCYEDIAPTAEFQAYFIDAS